MTDVARIPTQVASQANEAITATVDAIEPALGLPDTDPVNFVHALREISFAVARKPMTAVKATARWGVGLADTSVAAASRVLGYAEAPGPIEVQKGDRRFKDPAWDSNPWYFGLQQNYLLWQRWLQDIIADAEVDEHTRRKAAWAADQIANVLAPTNFLATNPAALKKAFDTAGTSLLRGLRNVVDDFANNEGRPLQVDTSPFTLGENLAATPGQVVYRNDLMELIQYAPQTEQVHQIPIVVSPPWINKYYIMDLAPGKSWIEWMVQHGHTVFAISYRNPDESMAGVNFDNYLKDGLKQAVDVASEVSGAEKVNVVGLCLGGTLTVMLLAYLAALGEDRVNAVTLQNTLVDFVTDPGPLGNFLDESTISTIEAKMAERGYLEGSQMAGTFDALRSNDLIWQYVSNNWLMGGDPPAFDILAWNSDQTRLPAAFHSSYLRACYMENRLARGEMEVDGTQLNLEKVRNDIFIVGAVNDHIAPWRGSYQTTQLLPGNVRFVLTNAGHIAGIVNPPSDKAYHYTGDQNPADPDAWREKAEKVDDTWWETWAQWAQEHSGEMAEPPQMGSEANPPLYAAPGKYVRGEQPTGAKG